MPPSLLCNYDLIYKQEKQNNSISNEPLPVLLKLALIEREYQLLFINQRSNTQIPLERVTLDKSIQQKILTQQFLSALRKCVLEGAQNQYSHYLLANQINKIFDGYPPPSLSFLF